METVKDRKWAGGKVGKWALALLLTCSPAHLLTCSAADITKGYSFVSGEQNVTHTKLNNLVDLATINTDFFTGKNAAAPASSDTFLFVSGGAFKRCSFSQMLLGNTNTIYGQTEDTTPVGGDYVALFDPVTGLLKKSDLWSVVFTNDALINGRTNWPAPNRTTTFLLAYDTATGGYSKLSRSNLFYQWAEFATFTNQLAHTAPTNQDRLLIWDATATTNKQIHLATLITNAPAASAAAGTDVMLGYSFGDNLFAKFTVNQLRQAITNNASSPTLTNSLPIRFTSNESNLVAGVVCNVAHNLGGVPHSVHWVLVCKTTTAGFAVGDEITIDQVYHSSGGRSMASYGWNSTNVFMMFEGLTSLSFHNKTDGSIATFDETKWAAKCYAIRFPQL